MNGTGVAASRYGSATARAFRAHGYCTTSSAAVPGVVPAGEAEEGPLKRVSLGGKDAWMPRGGGGMITGFRWVSCGQIGGERTG